MNPVRAVVGITLSLFQTVTVLASSDQFTSTDTPIFKPVRASKHEGGTTYFAGSGGVAGRFVVSWWKDGEDVIRIKLLPDEKSKQFLPYLSNGLPASAVGIQVGEIEFDGSEANVRKLLPPEKVRAFLSKRVHEATGTVSMVIGSYISGVDCDHRWYMAKIQSVKAVRELIVTEKSNERFRC